MQSIFANTIFELTSRRRAKEQVLNGQLSIKEAIGLCANTGNVCFVDSLSRQAKYKEYIQWNEIEKYDGCNSNFVIPAANWIGLQNGAVIKDIFCRLKGMKGALTVIGLGIHMTKESSSIDMLLNSIDAETRDILRFISNRAELIGIRGEITAEVLDRLGIHNHCVIGCPSFYEYRRTEEELRKDMSGACVFSIRPDSSEGSTRQGKMVEIAKEVSSYIVFQDMRDMPRTKYEGIAITQRDMENKFGEKIMDEAEMTTYWKEKGEIFFTLDEWKSWLIRMNISFAFGSRFHGNMMAFLSGIPALWIRHDYRMQELIDSMNLPYITYDMLDEFGTAEELKTYALSCYNEKFFKNYQDLVENYIVFLKKNRVKHMFTENGEI